jgi:V/A-type H+-transporting ATPase subunit K
MNTQEMLGAFGYVAALTLSAIGSLLGTNAAGMVALGAWKKCFLENRPAPFLLVAFVGAPLSQTIYGLILMNAVRAAPEAVTPLIRFAIGLIGGLILGASAWIQGRAGALASDAHAASGKGFGNFIIVIGIIETVALMAMVFFMTALK